MSEQESAVLSAILDGAKHSPHLSAQVGSSTVQALCDKTRLEWDAVTSALASLHNSGRAFCRFAGVDTDNDDEDGDGIVVYQFIVKQEANNAP